MSKSKQIILFLVISLALILLLLYPFILGFIFCPSGECIQPERFGGLSIYGPKNLLLEPIIYFFDNLATIHRYLAFKKLGILMAVIFCFVVGWVISRFIFAVTKDKRSS